MIPRLAHRFRSAPLLATLALVTTALIGTAVPAQSLEETYEDGHDHGERSATAPSFNESDGCDSPAGVRGPYVRATGVQGNDEPLYGPWGDYFGRDIGEVRSRLVRMQLPMMDRPKDFLVHELVAPALQKVINNLNAAAAQGKRYTIRADHSFSYNPRTIGGRLSLSFHAIGASIDINSTTNPYRGDNTLITDMPSWFVKAWTDAGFCWGGDFQSVKDPMHFSWRGPLYTPGYGPIPPPAAPRTARDSFDRRAVAGDTVFAAPTFTEAFFFADADRDGAPDVVRVDPVDGSGRVRIEAARAHHDYETCSFSLVSSAGVAAAGRRVLYADGDRDGRPDLWSIDESGPSAIVSVYSYASGFQQRVSRIVTDIAPSPEVEYLVGDHDRDGHADLYVVRRTVNRVPLGLEIWSGAGGFGDRLLAAELRLNANTLRSGKWRFDLGDHDVDGVPDLYVFNVANPVRLRIFAGDAGFAGAATSVKSGVPVAALRTIGIADYDGDGRDDLYSLRGDGSVDVHLGGNRPAGADLSYWFRDPEPWQDGSGCGGSTGFRAMTAVGDVTGDGTDEIALVFARSGQARDRLEVRDRVTGRTAAGALLSPGARSLAAASFTSSSGPALAVLAIGADGDPEISTWHAGTGALLSRVPAPPGPVPVALDAADDGAGAPLLALLSYAADPTAAIVATFDETGTLVRTIELRNIAPVALRIVPDADGDGVPDVAVLGTAPGRDAPVVRTASGASGAGLASIKLKAQLAPVAMLAVPDFTGGPAAELAVLAEDVVRRRTNLIVTDGERKRLVTTQIEAADSRPVGLALLADFGGGPADEVAVAVRVDGAGRTWLRVYDAGTGGRLSSVGLTEPHDPVGLAAASDRSGNGAGEALLARLGGDVIAVLERDADTGQRLGTHTFS